MNKQAVLVAILVCHMAPLTSLLTHVWNLEMSCAVQCGGDHSVCISFHNKLTLATGMQFLSAAHKAHALITFLLLGIVSQLNTFTTCTLHSSQALQQPTVAKGGRVWKECAQIPRGMCHVGGMHYNYHNQWNTPDAQTHHETTLRQGKIFKVSNGEWLGYVSSTTASTKYCWLHHHDHNDCPPHVPWVVCSLCALR